MYILLDTCQNPAILRGLYFIDIILNLAFTIIPIVLIIMIMVDFAKATISGDTDKAKKTTKIIPKRIIYAVLVFAVPWIVDVFMGFMNDLGFDSDYNVCLENARSGNFDYYDKLYEEEKRIDEQYKVDNDKYSKKQNNNESKVYTGSSLNDKNNSNINFSSTGSNGTGNTGTNVGSAGNTGTNTDSSLNSTIENKAGTTDCKPSSTYYINTPSGVNCRLGPGTSFDKVSAYSNCSAITACQSTKDSGWYYTSNGCYVTGQYITSSKPSGCSTNSTTTQKNTTTGTGSGSVVNGSSYSTMADMLVGIARAELGNTDRSRYGAGSGVAYCGYFVNWAMKKTQYNGVNLFNDIVEKEKTLAKPGCAGATAYQFDTSSNLAFHKSPRYGGSYTPKKGDIIYFWYDGQNGGSGWYQTLSLSGNGCQGLGADHVGIVESVSDGNVTNISGNCSSSGNNVCERTYSLNSNDIMGYGSWYKQ